MYKYECCTFVYRYIATQWWLHFFYHPGLAKIVYSHIFLKLYIPYLKFTLHTFRGLVWIQPELCEKNMLPSDINSSRPPSAKGLYPWTWVHLALPHLSRWESPFLRGWRPRSLVPNHRWCRHPWNLHEQISLNSKSWSYKVGPPR